MTLRRLERSADFQVADGSSDIRGWPLYESSGEKVGRIDGLLFDPEALEVRYAIVDVWDHLDMRRVLLPVGQIEIDGAQRRVVSTTHNRHRLMMLQEYDERDFSAQDEKRHLLDYMPGRHHGEKAARDGYRHAIFRDNLPHPIRALEERLRLGKRETQLGEVTVTRQPILDMIEQDVEVQHERVEVTRRQVRRPASGNERVTIEGDTIRIPVLGEEIVVERRPIVIEEIEITRVPYTTIEKVRQELRREQVEITGADGAVFAAAEPTEAERPRVIEDPPRIDLHEARNPGGHRPH